MSRQEDGMRRCDIVMKGGVTSGVVYPAAVRVIADHFRFMNIGGTSAGAIAASLTAAAEYRRQTGGGLAGFDRIAKIPGELSKDDTLLRLFQPNRQTRSLFYQIVRLTQSRSLFDATLKLFVSAFVNDEKIWSWAMIGLGAILAALLLYFFPAPGTLFAAGLLLILAAMIGFGVALWRTIARAEYNFIANGYGLSSGISDADPKDNSALSAWLSKLLDEIAGLPAGEHLTFGHLWFGRRPQASDSPSRPNEPVVNLEMITTCLSHGRPYTLPTSENIFYFDPAKLRHYIPTSVVTAMQRASRPGSSPDALTEAELGPYVRMPYARDTPVVLCARMSLAFPVLLSAVELGARAYGEIQGPGDERRPPEPCWFADGGLSSNFPIHFFDAPLPRWPTLAINLGTFSAEDENLYDPQDQSPYVWMPSQNHAGLAENWLRFSDLGSYFGNAMLSSVKDWSDNVQMKVPGFRDRIVTVKLRACEGGLNLRMPASVIDALVDRGRIAGDMLVKRFATVSAGTFTGTMDWENHRWVRCRVFAATAQAYLERFTRGYTGGQPGDVSYDQLLLISEKRTTPPYVWKRQSTATAARPIMRSTAAYSVWLRHNSIAFDQGAPRPEPTLVKRPTY